MKLFITLKILSRVLGKFWPNIKNMQITIDVSAIMRMIYTNTSQTLKVILSASKE